MLRPTAKKSLILILLLIFFSYLGYLSIKDDNIITGRSLFEMQPTELHHEFMLSRHYSVDQMIRFQLDLLEEKLAAINKKFPVSVSYATMNQLPKDFSIDELDVQSPAAVTFYYDEVEDQQSGQKLRIVRDFTANTNYLNYYQTKDLPRESLASLSDEKSREHLKQITHFCLTPSRKQVTLLFLKESPQISYSPKELESLESFHNVMVILQYFITKFRIDGESVEQRPLREMVEQKNPFGDQWCNIQKSDMAFIYAYSDYFLAEHKWRIIAWVFRRKLPLAVTILIISVLITYLLRKKGFETLLKETLYQKGVIYDRKMIIRILMKKPHFFIFPYFESDMKPFIEKISGQLLDDQVDRTLKAQAKDIMERADRFGDNGTMKNDYRIAMGKTKADSATRYRALYTMINGLQRMERRQKRLSANAAVSAIRQQETGDSEKHPSNNQPYVYQDNREIVLDDLFQLIGTETLVAQAKKVCHNLSFYAIHRLFISIEILQKISQQSVGTLLFRQDLDRLLKADSRFWNAISAGQIEVILEELDLDEKEITTEEEVKISDHGQLLHDREVYIFGGYKADLQRHKLIAAVKELGATDCQVLTISELSKVKSKVVKLDRKRSLTILVATDNRHAAKNLLDSRNISYLPVNSLNKKRFQLEIIAGLSN